MISKNLRQRSSRIRGHGVSPAKIQPAAKRGSIKFKPPQTGGDGRVSIQSPSTRRANLENAKRKPEARRGGRRGKSPHGKATKGESVARGILVVVADLGRLKAYRLEDAGVSSRPRMKLIEEWHTGAIQHLVEVVTDQAGKFRRGPATGGPNSSDGEEHNLELERRRRAAKVLAQHIDALLDRDDVDECYLAADSRINQIIVEKLKVGHRARIRKNINANLSKASVAQVINQFCE